ncbi:MAG: FAD-dependent oxidoreductase [Fimbriimonadaceae bacterium]|nr:FAD-dependent oxidoreductase [Fimbriimonadaceae bacterium]
MKIGVIGAGISGLRTGQLLSHQGHEIVIFEARDRVGGNLLTIQSEDGFHEAGGEWIDAEHKRTIALVRELGDEPVPADDRPSRVMFRGSIRQDDDLWMDAANDLRVVHEEAKLIAAAMGERPWLDGRWMAADGRTVGQFVQEFAISERGHWLVESQLRSDEGTDIEEVGLAGWLYAYQNYLGRDSNQGEMSAYRFPRGAGTLCEQLAEGQEIHLKHAIRQVQHDENQVTVVSESGSQRFDHVVVTIPPALLQSSFFSPEPGRTLPRAWETAPRSPTVKVALTFKNCFWEDGSDWSGAFLCDLPYQQVWSGGQGLECTLLCYVNGERARSLSAHPDSAVERTLRSIDETHPGAADAFEKGFFYDWINDPWSGGGFTYCRPGFLSHGAPYLGRPMGRVHFAGEGTSQWLGFIEGALESAERVAEEIGT